MATYLTAYEIKMSLKTLVRKYLEECKNCDELSQDFIELIQHNFLAEYVYYNKEEKTIEIGIEDKTSNSAYPEIKAYSYSFDKAEKVINKSFKNEKPDLEYYGRLINKNSNASEIVVMD